MKDTLVTVDVIRELLAGDGRQALSRAAVTQFVAEGMPKKARGRYPLEACVRWYVARLRAVIHERAVETSEGKIVRLDEAQRRLTLAKAENEEMTAKERRGELIPLSLFISETAKIITTTKHKLMNLPARLAPSLEHVSRAEAREVLQGGIKGALSELAQAGQSDPQARAVKSARKPSPTR